MEDTDFGSPDYDNEAVLSPTPPPHHTHNQLPRQCVYVCVCARVCACACVYVRARARVHASALLVSFLLFVTLVEYFVVTRMPGDSYRRRFRALLLCFLQAVGHLSCCCINFFCLSFPFSPPPGSPCFETQHPTTEAQEQARDDFSENPVSHGSSQKGAGLSALIALCPHTLNTLYKTQTGQGGGEKKTKPVFLRIPLPPSPPYRRQPQRTGFLHKETGK